ncbi:uncharacterized protein DUF2508 [Natranaerovirga hydrolytica]|uniref:Uncharacterized protein DUF2508 n=1 Tax=Natranaerovirga hydrolytica TaxID=680378 RepID=A0A4R1N1Y3_9FIRM|nr:YaaL family protein [Natranaerovirga hydrolytica]TCL00078.1 uncharacterized protein DUF2508 [Natranaerovirga hydrolytica]
MKPSHYNKIDEAFNIENRTEEERLLKNIKEVKKALDIANINFENITEPQLIDSCIYELRAMQMKYEYLLTLAKARNLVSEIKK